MDIPVRWWIILLRAIVIGILAMQNLRYKMLSGRSANQARGSRISVVAGFACPVVDALSGNMKNITVPRVW